LSARAEGPLETWRDGRAIVDVTSLEARAGELPVHLVEPARVSYADGRLQLIRFEAAAGETRISGAGVLPVDRTTVGPLVNEALALTVDGDIGEILRASEAIGIRTSPLTAGEGPVTLLGRVTGSVDAPVLEGDLELGPASVTINDLPAVSDIRIRAHLEDNWLELRDAAADYQGAHMAATGRAPISLFVPGVTPRPDGALSVKAQVTGVSANALASIVDPATLEQLEGGIDASVDLAGPSLDLDALNGEMRLDRLELRLADLPVSQRVPTRIVVRDGFARIANWEWIGQGATLGLRGQVRLRDRQAALLADGQIDLRMITPFVRAAGVTTAGRMEPRLSITGPIDNPRIDGDLTLQDGQMRLVEPRVIISDLGARVVLTRTIARITTLTGSVNGGALNGTGQIEYGPDTPFSAQLSTDIQGTALEYPAGLRSELNAMVELDVTGPASAGRGSTPPPSLAQDAFRATAGSRRSFAEAERQTSLEGPPDATGRLNGTITIVRGAYREPMAVVTGMLTSLRARQLTAPTASPFLARLAIDLRLLTEEDIIVDNNYARAQVGGDLRVSGTAAAPVLSGRAELREGGQLFVGRNVYTINSGTITFANPVSIDPEVNVEATTRVRRDEIVVRLNGTAQTLTPELSSPTSPELGQADLTSLLLTGRRIDELAPDDAAFIGAQVIGNLSGEVLGFAGRAIGLDSVRLGGVDDAAGRDPTAIATEVDPTSRLTFNKSLRPDIDVTFSQSLRKSDAQTWIVDYLPSRQIQIRLVSDDEDLRSYGFRHDLAFGGGNRVAPAVQQPVRQALRVSEVIVRGELALPEARLRQLLRLKPGDRFDFAEWQTDRDRLEQFYRQQGRLTARIGATRSDGPDGEVLTYEVTAGPQTRIDVSGAELSRGVLARLERAWAESVFDDFLIDEAVQIAKEALVADGYLRAMVTARLLTESETRRLEIAIARGDRVGSITVRLEGPDPQLNAEVEQWLDQQRLTARAATDPGLVQREVTAHLRARGYLGARVTTGAPLFEGATAIVPITIEAGPAYVLGQVRFEGAEGLSPAALREAVALTEGTPYDPAAVEPARDRLIALYRREGFASPTVNARESAHDGVVDVVFTSDPGPRQFMEEVTVTGNRSVDDDVITHALKLPSGEPLRTNDLLSARRRVFDTGLFRRVDITTEAINQEKQAPTAIPTSSQLPMRVRVTIEEWPALRARYGFRVNEERPPSDIGRRDLTPGFSGDITRRTLFGRAITIGGAAEYQRRERLARTFVTMPTLMGLPLISSFVAERSREDSAASTLVTDRTRLSWEQRTRIAGNLTLSYAYRFDRDHTFDTKPDPEFPYDVRIDVARLTGAVARDTRDDPTDTARGLLVSSAFEYAAEALGSEIPFVRFVAQAYVFRPWRHVVFASAGRLGLARPLAGRRLILSERFFAGGGRTVRGVIEDGLGSRDSLGNPIGGQALLVFNQEVRVPLYRWLRGVGFLDAGNVFPKASALSLSDLAGTVGFGFRVTTPIGIMRADYGRRVWPAPTERSGKWIFGLGQMF
jgi:outer membrane protein assembly factor BamA